MNAHVDYIYVLISVPIKHIMLYLLPPTNSLLECPLVYHSDGGMCGLNKTTVGLSQSINLS